MSLQKFRLTSLFHNVILLLTQAYPMEVKIGELKKNEDSANSCKEIPEQPIDDPASNEFNANVYDNIVEKIEKPQDDDIPERSSYFSISKVITDHEHQKISDKFIHCQRC